MILNQFFNLCHNLKEISLQFNILPHIFLTTAIRFILSFTTLSAGKFVLLIKSNLTDI